MVTGNPDNSETTSKISVNAAASDVKSALEALSNIDEVAVTRNANIGTEGYSFTVTFTGDYVDGNVPLLVMTDTVYGDSASTTDPYQNIAGAEPTGTFTVTFDDTNSNPAVRNALRCHKA